MNKKKIINDPIYGFIPITRELVFDLLEHPVFQRLRRIKQLGMINLVYPGANHTRFHHALGAMHLMTKALDSLVQKGIEISEEEKTSACVAILLHDIGHGPFSHTLERTLVKGISHEEISLAFMQMINEEFNGALDMAIEIFEDKYKRHFLHELVSSQLDVDRLDYLTRDSFYTGVSEGIVGLERIIQMMNVVDDRLVIEEKGIYSVEKFLVARRLMYWQVYFHKTTIAADTLMLNILKRARHLLREGKDLFCPPALLYFLEKDMHHQDLIKSKWRLQIFSTIDDVDIISAIKVWSTNEDKILSELCSSLIYRRLPRVLIQKKEITKKQVQDCIAAIMEKRPWLSAEETEYFYMEGDIMNEAYGGKDKDILILTKSGEIIDIENASDNYNIRALRPIVKKFYLSAPK